MKIQLTENELGDIDTSELLEVVQLIHGNRNWVKIRVVQKTIDGEEKGYVEFDTDG
jgi:hypothetical protein